MSLTAADKQRLAELLREANEARSEALDARRAVTAAYASALTGAGYGPTASMLQDVEHWERVAETRWTGLQAMLGFLLI